VLPYKQRYLLLLVAHYNRLASRMQLRKEKEISRRSNYPPADGFSPLPSIYTLPPRICTRETRSVPSTSSPHFRVFFA
jgi:hypothetical protein